ncbi:MAG: MBL fold metallo-hydrolase [Bacteroidales bacterium]|nr:MBL fold metallo-hydrolase [Bacteroidales bacterium]
MKHWKTSHGYEIIQIPNGRSSCYLIRKAGMLILIDTGKKGRFKVIWDQVSRLKGKQPLDLIIQTHTHYDHCQNTARIKEMESCKVMGSEYEIGFAKKGYTPLPRGSYILTEIISWAGRILLKGLFRHEPFETDITLREEYMLKAPGFLIRILATPGHTRGSVSILVDDEIALVGDTMIGFIRNTIFSPYADEPKEMIRSWKKLLDTPCTLFLPGHGQQISRSLLEKEYEKYARKPKLMT